MKRMLLFLFVFSQILFAKDFQVNFKNLQPGTYELTFALHSYRLATEEHGGELYSNLVISSGVFLENKGFARLPYVAVAVQLPPQKNMDLIVIPGEYEDIQLEHPLLPSRGVIYRDQNPEEIPYEIDPASLNGEWYPQDLANDIRPFIFRDVRGTSVRFYPFRYNGKSQTLRVYKSLTVRLIENDEPPTNPLTNSHENRIREVQGMYNSIFVNSRSSSSLHMAQYGDLLVITTARDESAIAPYIQWKKEKGFKVYKEVVATGTLVKSLIQQKYDENPNLLYVQLVGDWEDIQSELGTSSNLPMDPDMGCVSGSDDFPDIAIGRLSANSASDVTVQVNKVLNYEKTPGGGTDWFITATGIASDQGPGDDNEKDYEHEDVIWNDKLDPFTFDYYNAIYDPSASKTDVSNAVNSGTSLINYTGHGSSTSWGTTGFNNDDVNNLTNGNLLPWIISVACNNGEFNLSGDCFAEAWLKKDGGGAVMFLGSTISQPWDPPMRGQDYFMDVLTGGYNYDDHAGQNGINTSEQRTTIGAIVVNGFNLMLSESNTSSDLETVQTWTTFGDPSMQVRTAPPAALSLSNETIRVGQDFSTTVTSNGQPVEDALVTISQNDVYYSGLTDANGDVTITQDFTAGTALLVVTAFNCETIYKNVDVVSANGPWIEIASYSIDDTTTGNGNGKAEYNEALQLNVNARNTGNETAFGVQGVLSTSDVYLTISDSTNDYGDMASGVTIPGPDAFALNVLDGAPDQHSAPCRVTFTDNAGNSWVSDLELIINAPVLTTGGYSIDDAASGNGNGTLDIGETADFIVPTTNSGHAVSAEAVGSISTVSAYLTLNSNSDNLGALAPGDTVNARFNITASSSTPSGTEADIYYTVTAGAYSHTDTFTIVIGYKPVYLMSDDTVYVNDGYFYDSGGADADYGNKESLTMTFYPANRAPAVKVIFDSFSLSDFDQLSIYDGPNTSSAQVDGSPFSGTTNPGEIVANNPDGALTFHFESNFVGTSFGWSSEILSTVVADVPANKSAVRSSFALMGNYPNPFNPSTMIQYQIPESAPVKLVVYDITGRKVRTLINSVQTAGEHRVLWDARDGAGRSLASGVYFYRLTAGSHKAMAKMLLMR